MLDDVDVKEKQQKNIQKREIVKVKRKNQFILHISFESEKENENGI